MTHHNGCLGLLARISATFLLAVALVFTSPGSLQAETPISPASEWAIGELADGELYALFPTEWYEDGTFLQPITKEQWEWVLAATAAKLDGLGLSKRELNERDTLPDEAALSRGDVVDALYFTLTQYDLPASFAIDESSSAADYMQQNGVLKGTGSGLSLDRSATVEQAAVLAARLIDHAYDTAGKSAKGLIWKATHGANTVYLLGSIHIGVPEMYPMDPTVRDAFASADSLWVEANISIDDPELLAVMAETMMYVDGSSLSDHLSPETYEKLQQVLESLGIPSGGMDIFKPWAITLTLSMMSLTEPTVDQIEAAGLGVDMYFIERAMLDGKPIHELEGLQFQIEMMDSVPLEEQQQELDELLEFMLTGAGEEENASGQKQAAELFDSLIQQWIAGDAEQFAMNFALSDVELMDNNAGSGMSQRLFGERDKHMADKIADLLEQEEEHTAFVVVGAGHFVIEGMIIDQLIEKGYDVQYVYELEQ